MYQKRKGLNLSFAPQLSEFGKDSKQICMTSVKGCWVLLLPGASGTCPHDPSELGLQWLQVLVVRLMDLWFVQWGFLGPLKQIFIHIPIVTAKHRAECHILKIKRVHQSNSVWANCSQQLLYALIYLGNLRLCHDASLKKIPCLLTDSIETIQET